METLIRNRTEHEADQYFGIDQLIEGIIGRYSRLYEDEDGSRSFAIVEVNAREPFRNFYLCLDNITNHWEYSDFSGRTQTHVVRDDERLHRVIAERQNNELMITRLNNRELEVVLSSLSCFSSTIRDSSIEK